MRLSTVLSHHMHDEWEKVRQDVINYKSELKISVCMFVNFEFRILIWNFEFWMNFKFWFEIMNIDFKFRIFDKIKFDLDEILYSGAFEVADHESEFKIQKFNMANPNGRPKCKKLLDLEEILYSEVFEVYPGRFTSPPPPASRLPSPFYSTHGFNLFRRLCLLFVSL